MCWRQLFVLLLLWLLLLRLEVRLVLQASSALLFVLLLSPGMFVLLLLLLLLGCGRTESARHFVDESAEIACVCVGAYALVNLVGFGLWPCLHLSEELARLVALSF